MEFPYVIQQTVLSTKHIKRKGHDGGTLDALKLGSSIIQWRKGEAISQNEMSSQSPTRLHPNLNRTCNPVLRAAAASGGPQTCGERSQDGYLALADNAVAQYTYKALEESQCLRVPASGKYGHKSRSPVSPGIF
ncbi:hypothetical protein Bbelb_311440 [Branchiostoma belcheri]|nr:hypothetical protein Bbelb_311440 [Branchiostoma belcheri]